MCSPDIERVISQKTLAVPANTITAPFDYLQLLPSNNNKIRSTCLIGFNVHYFHISDTTVIAEIGTIIDTFHAASLLIDDIEDDSTFRRGNPCAHLRYGLPATLNSGNLMYFQAMKRAFQLLPAHYTRSGRNGSPGPSDLRSQMVDVFIEEMVNLHVGQGFDIYWRDNFTEVARAGLPSVSDYLEVVMHKTGGLFRLAVRMLGLFATDGFEAHSLLSQDVIKLANLLGIIYQIRDDYMNLADERYAKLKGINDEDLIEGKLSLPILYTLLNSGSDSALYLLYADCKTPSERRAHGERLKDARRSISDSQALQYTYGLLQEYIEKAKGLIGRTGDESAQILIKFLATLSDVKKP